MDHRSEGRPLEHTRAARMLSQGVRRRQEAAGSDLRQLAEELGYRSAVAVSHMATGRAPIPVDRAVTVAKVLGLDPRVFLEAVIEQRFPEVATYLAATEPPATREALLVHDLEELAGCSLDDLPSDVAQTLKEVVADRRPSARWASLNELPVLAAVRAIRPDISSRPLSREDRDRLIAALKTALLPET